MSFWYLATPYSKYPGGLVAAFEEACRQTALLIAAKVPVFCPIAHTHPVALLGQLDPYDHTIWMPSDQPMMDAACGIIVCLMDGWKESDGIKFERDYFIGAGKPLVLMVPGIVPKLPVIALKKRNFLSRLTFPRSVALLRKQPSRETWSPVQTEGFYIAIGHIAQRASDRQAQRQKQCCPSFPAPLGASKPFSQAAS